MASRAADFHSPFLAEQSIMDKLDEIGRDVTSIKEQMDKVLQGIEVVRATIVNLESCPIPTIFTIEPQPTVPSIVASTVL